MTTLAPTRDVAWRSVDTTRHRAVGSTVTRYLLGEVSKPFALVLGVLVALFASYSVANFVSDPLGGLLPAGTIAELTFLKGVISLDVLIPVSLYASVILAYSKLHENFEFVAMAALSMDRWVQIRAVLILAGCLAVLVGSVSLYARPWAYEKLHALSSGAATFLDVDDMEAGSFYVGQNGTRVIFLAHRDKAGSPARNVFVKLRHRDRVEIISAQSAFAVPPTPPATGTQVDMHDAYMYELDHSNGDADQVLQADGITIDPNSHGGGEQGYSAVASSTRHIAASRSSEDVAEFQWRLSTPLSTLLLGLLGIPLSRRRPRQGGGVRLLTALLIYVGYYLLDTSARTLVQHGSIPRFPGIWWVPALLAAIMLTAIYRPRLRLRTPGLRSRQRSA